MMIAATGSLQAGPNAPILYRGAYEQMFPMIVEDGYQGVELHIENSRTIDRAALHRELKKHRLQLTSIGTGAAYARRGWNLADRDAGIRKQALECLREHMITAAPHHALVIVGSMQGRIRDAGSEEAFRFYMEESLGKLDRLAAQYGVMIGYEIMNRYESDFLTCIADGVRYLEDHAYKRIRLHIDTVHMNIDEQDPAQAIRNAGSWIGHVHIADNDRYYPGHGHICFRPVFQALKDIGYDGAMALEILSRPEMRSSGRRALGAVRFFMEEIYGE